MEKMHIRSAGPVYVAGAVWLAVGLIAPGFLLGLSGFAVTAVLSAAAGLLSRRFFPGRDVEIPTRVDTGDEALDREIEQGRARLEALRRANAAIEDPGITDALNRMNAAGEQIFGTLAQSPDKYPLARRFLSYYLPTLEKLMGTYQRLMDIPAKGENIQASMAHIQGTMGLLAEAFEKFADNLFADTELDVDAEITVLKTMMAGDDLIAGEAPARQQAAGSAAPGGR